MNEKQKNGARVQGYLFLLLYAFLFIIVGKLFQPFLSVLVWAGVAYAITQPLYTKLAILRNGTERPAWFRSLLAGILALAVLVMIVGPMILIAFVLLGQLNDLSLIIGDAYQRYQGLLRGSGLTVLSDRLLEMTGGVVDISSVNLAEQTVKAIQGLGEHVVGVTGLVLRNATSMIAGLAIFTFTLFFFYVDGRHLMKVFVDAMPIRNELSAFFLKKFRDTGRDLVLGYFVVGLFQGAMAFIVFLIMGVTSPLLLGLLTTIASFIPMVGSSLVWIPVVLAKVLSGDTTGALILFALSAFFISTLDNLLRPLFLKSRIKMHPLLIFFSIIGGLQLFGFNGLLLGPLLLVLFFTAVDIFARTYGRKVRRHEANGEGGGIDDIEQPTHTDDAPAN
ncbi:MAG: hypothetical protein A2Y38_15050 [Spirochaetes bacterium GWB1_59_5]|nr:MAG: hypothetical protein A2Y38_15050 [Spirochaetes bacterium GWB1_59_5]